MSMRTRVCERDIYPSFLLTSVRLRSLPRLLFFVTATRVCVRCVLRNCECCFCFVGMNLYVTQSQWLDCIALVVLNIVRKEGQGVKKKRKINRLVCPLIDPSAVLFNGHVAQAVPRRQSDLCRLFDLFHYIDFFR